MEFTLRYATINAKAKAIRANPIITICAVATVLATAVLAALTDTPI